MKMGNLSHNGQFPLVYEFFKLKNH